MAETIITCPNCKDKIPLKVFPTKSQLNSQVHAPGASGIFESVQFVETPAEDVTVVERRNFWSNEATTAALSGIFAGTVVLTYGWYYDVGNGLIVAGVTLVGILGLPILKIWLHRPPRATEPGVSEKTVKLNIETRQGTSTYLDDITDSRVIDNLERLGNALVNHPELSTNFSKAAIRRHCGIGGRKYDAIVEELKRLNYCHVAPNNRTILSLRCKALLKKSATIAYPKK